MSKKNILMGIIIAIFASALVCCVYFYRMQKRESYSVDSDISQSTDDISSENTEESFSGKREKITSDESALKIIESEEFQKLVSLMSSSAINDKEYTAPVIADNSAYEYLSEKCGLYAYSDYIGISEGGAMYKYLETDGSFTVSDSTIHAEHYAVEDNSLSEVQVETKMSDVVWFENDYVFFMADTNETYLDNSEIYNLYVLHFIDDSVEVYGLYEEPVSSDYYLGDNVFAACSLLFTGTKSADITSDLNDSDIEDNEIAIQAARDFLSNYAGAYEEELYTDTFYEVDILEIVNDDSSIDYGIGTKGLDVFYSNQCIDATNENGKQIFYFCNHLDSIKPGYTEYYKVECEGNYLYIYYGDSKDSCTDLGSKCNLAIPLE